VATLAQSLAVAVVGLALLLLGFADLADDALAAFSGGARLTDHAVIAASIVATCVGVLLFAVGFYRAMGGETS
jgi:hypothetical protein